MPLPNVYLVTVQHGGEVHTTYIAADYSGSAIRKAQRWCVEHHGFRPTRGNSDTKMRRFKLGDYLETPEGLGVAMINAHEAHERDTLQKLSDRRTEVDQLLSGMTQAQQQGVDFDAVEAALAEELRNIA